MALVKDGITDPVIYAGGVQGKGTGIWDARAQYVQSRQAAPTAAVYFPGTPDVPKQTQIVSGGVKFPAAFSGMAEYVQTRLAAPTMPVNNTDGSARVADALKSSVLDIFKNIGAEPDQPEYTEAFWGGPAQAPAQDNRALLMVLGAAAVGLAVIMATKGA